MAYPPIARQSLDERPNLCFVRGSFFVLNGPKRSQRAKLDDLPHPSTGPDNGHGFALFERGTVLSAPDRGLVYALDNGRLSGELDLSYTRSPFRSRKEAGQHIPGKVSLVVSSSLNWKPGNGWTIAPRARYVGRYPLIENNTVRARSSVLLNLQVARDWRRFGTGPKLFSLLDSKDHDIDYFYASRLPGEPLGGVENIHYHVFQPRSVGLALRGSF